MPLYEFRCPNGHDFEMFYRSIGSAASEAVCPVCGTVATRRMSAAGLVFKGSGFYITDYGKDGKKAEREAATAEKSKSDAAELAKSADAKSADPKAADSKSSDSKSSDTGAPAADTKSGTKSNAASATSSATPKSAPATPAAKPRSSE
jgi:putative FmdB family regulatory protein